MLLCVFQIIISTLVNVVNNSFHRTQSCNTEYVNCLAVRACADGSDVRTLCYRSQRKNEKPHQLTVGIICLYGIWI